MQEINNDVFEIVDRLKEIDEGYFVMFNDEKNRIEIHNRFQNLNTLSFVCPNNKLDARVIDFCFQTRIENLDKIAKETESHNE